MRLFAFLLCFLSGIIHLHAQTPPNDDCLGATEIVLPSPNPCPSTQATTTSLTTTNSTATPSIPYSLPSSCSGGNIENLGKDVWFSTTTVANTTEILVESAEILSPNIVVFTGNSCGLLTPIACAVDNQNDGEVLLSLNTFPGQQIYIRVAGSDVDDTGFFSLVIQSYNDCSSCLLSSNFTVSPPPINGTYSTGSNVEFCFTIDQWDVTGTIEWLHAITFEAGSGWDLSSLNYDLPVSCGGDGYWEYYDFWQSCGTGQIFGPGFAYDSASGVGCGGVPNDGDPGNNWGDGLGGCSNINPGNPFTFCWSLKVNELASSGEDLSMKVRVWSDGDSGSWTQTGCNSGVESQILTSVLSCEDELPVIDLGPAVVVCNGDCSSEVTIDPNGGIPGNYDINVFDNQGNMIAYFPAITSMVTLDSLCPGSYSVSVVNLDEECNQFRLFDIPFVNPINLEANNFCTGDSVQIFTTLYDTTIQASFSWLGPNSFSSMLQNPVVSEEGFYNVTVTTTDSCVYQETIYVFESEGPDFDILMNDLGCPDELTNIYVFGNDDYDYTWSTGETSDTISVFLTDTLQLEVTAVDNSGCSTTKDRIFYPELPIDVTFSQRPYDTLFGYQERCPTNSIAVFGDPNNYDYTFNGNAVSSGSYIHTIPDSLDQDTVFVSWLSPNGCYNGNDTVLVEPFYPNFIEADTIRLCGGAGIIVGQNTFLGDNYLWNTGDDTPFLAIEVEDTVTYSVTITRGCVFEDEVVVIEVPSLEVDLGPDQLVCSGDSISLSANVTNGFPPIDYYWEKNDVDIDNNAPVLVTAPDVGLNLYSVAIQDSLGCVDVDFVEVLLDSIPTPIQINQTSACEGDFIMLSLSQNYETYNWNTGQIGPEIMVNQPGLYCVTVVNASGCTAEACIEPIFNLEPTVPDIFCNASLTTINFNWATDPNNFYDVNVLTGQSGQLNNGNFVVDGLVFGEEVTIELVVTSPAGCVSSNTLSCITEDCPEIEVAIDPVAAICLEGASPFALEATVMGVSGAGTATWSGPGIVDAAAGIFDPLAVGAGVHPVVFTYEEGGCIGTASINILVDAPLAIPQLNCTATTSALSFNWPVDPAVENYTVNVLSGQTGSTNGNLITFNDLTPEEEVCIELIADPGNSCDEVMATLCCTTNACPDDVVIDVESLVEVCLDDSPFMIPVNISGGMGGGTISWSGPCIDPVSFLIDPQVCGPGAIPLTVTYSEGPCIYEENVVVNIYENWNSDFEIAASEACVDDIVLITYTGNADPGATYGWIFDGGTVISGSGAGPYEVIWSEAGTQTVILTVEGNGCAGITNTQSIEIFEPTEPLNVNCVSTTSSIEFFWEIPVGVDSVSVNYLSGPTGILGDSTLFIDNLNPETAVDVEFISYSNTACGDTSVIMSCMTLPCPDIMLTLINPSGIICLDENPAPFELMYDIVGSNGTGNINWSGPGIISATDGLFDPQQAGVGTHEIILTYTEDNCTYIQSTDIEVTEGYTFENLNLNCSDDGNTYSLSLDIQTPNGTINYESDVVASGDQLVVEVPNGPGCDTPFVFSTIKDCNCLTYAGTLDFIVANQCGFPFVSVQHNGDDFLVEDDLLRFVLHTNNGNVLGEILAISEEPVFEYDPAWSTDEVYYISAVAGEEAAFQELNLNDPCLSVSAPQAIVFQEAIDLAVTPDTLICSGQSVALQATYNTVDSIAWTPATGLSCTDCPDPLATPVQTTTYTLTAYNEAGCTEIAQLTIYVDEFPESLLPSAPAPVCAGEYVEICLPEGGNYTWTGPSNYFSVDDCLIWPGFDPIYAGDYIIEVDLGNGCTFTDTLTLNAVPEQAINFLTADLEACPNEVFELQADIENAISYIWFPTENVQTNDSSATLASITTPTVFTLLTQDMFGCDGEFNVVVTNPTDCEIDGQIPLEDFTSGNTPQQFFNVPASNGSNIRVYPNPSRNLVYVRSGATALQQLVVYDLSGKRMLNIRSGNHEAQIDVQQWPAGTYLLSIFHENGVQHEKIVVLE